MRRRPLVAIVPAMSLRWRKPRLATEDLPLVVLWNEMLAATGIPRFRAEQLVREGRFPIRDLPYHGYHARERARPRGRHSIDPRQLTFSKTEILRFIALPEDERESLTLLEWELPRCCHCPFHCPPVGATQREHPYSAHFKRRWWQR